VNVSQPSIPYVISVRPKLRSEAESSTGFLGMSNEVYFLGMKGTGINVVCVFAWTSIYH